MTKSENTLFKCEICSGEFELPGVGFEAELRWPETKCPYCGTPHEFIRSNGDYYGAVLSDEQKQKLAQAEEPERVITIRLKVGLNPYGGDGNYKRGLREQISEVVSRATQELIGIEWITAISKGEWEISDTGADDLSGAYRETNWHKLTPLQREKAEIVYREVLCKEGRFFVSLDGSIVLQAAKNRLHG